MFHRFANPARFLRFAAVVQPLFAGAPLLLLAAGSDLGRFASPPARPEARRGGA